MISLSALGSIATMIPFLLAAQKALPIHQRFSYPLNTEIHSEIKVGHIQLTFNTEQCSRKSSVPVFLHQIDIIPAKAEDSIASICSVYFQQKFTDTSFTLAFPISKLDSTNGFRVVLTYKQSYIEQNWIFYKKYGWMYTSNEVAYEFLPDNYEVGYNNSQLKFLQCRAAWRAQQGVTTTRITVPKFDPIDDFACKLTPGVY